MRLTALLLACAAVAGCSRSGGSTGQAPPYNTEIDVAEIMAHVMDPGAQAFWRGYGEVYTKNGITDLSPQNDADWKKVEDGAATVVAATNVLLLPAYARKPVADWNRYAEDVARLAIAGKEGADRQDKQAMYDIGGRLDEACDACHHQFVSGK